MESTCSQAGLNPAQNTRPGANPESSIPANPEAWSAVMEKMTELNGKMGLLLSWTKSLDTDRLDTDQEFHDRACLVLRQVRDIWPFWKQAAMDAGVDVDLLLRLESNLDYLDRILGKHSQDCQ